MAVVKNILYFALICIAISQKVQCYDDDMSDGDIAMQQLFQIHMARILREHPCREPQAKLMKAADLLSDLPKDVLVMPFETVVMRCENSGCCRRRSTSCGPSKIETIDLLFKIHDITTKLASFRSVKAENHVECSCKSV
jgi:hypothetical protein